MSVLTGAEALATLLGRSGWTTVFAYPGTSELELCAAIAGRDGTRLINARGDREAVFMAAGGNLVGPASCAAVLHGSRGLTNALGAVADVRRSEVATLCLVGMPSRASARFLPPHGEPSLIEAAGAFASAAFDGSMVEGFDPLRFVGMVGQSLAVVQQAPHGPVLLGLPHDLLTCRFVPGHLVADVDLPAGPRRAPEVASALTLLRAAQRPVVLVDDYLLRWPGAERALGRLAARLGAPVLQVAYSRGPMLFQRLQRGVVPAFLGPYDPTDQGQRVVVESADVLITVEDRNMYPRVVGRLPGCPKVAVTSSGPATAKNGYLRASDALVVGDVRSILDMLTDGLGASPSSGSVISEGSATVSLASMALAFPPPRRMCSRGRSPVVCRPRRRRGWWMTAR